MNRRYWMRFAIVTAVAMSWTEACSNNGVGGPSLVPLRVTISGPSRLAPGSTAQLTAVADYAEGSKAVSDVTSTVVWRSSDTSILTIDAAGRVTAQQSGEATIIAALNPGLGASQHITVVPPGTFKVAGVVAWADHTGQNIDGVSIQVTAGTGTGLATVTNAQGSYALYGVAGQIELTVSKPAYVTIRQTATIDTDSTLNFQIQGAATPPKFDGTYVVEITADPACATSGQGAIPDSARVRRYSAAFDVTHGLLAQFSGADFLSSRNIMFGTARPDGATMDVNNIDYYQTMFYPPPDFAEVLPSGDVYCPSGSIILTGIGADFVGTLNGILKIRHQPSGDLFGQCSSTHHAITFTKQNGPAATGRRR
jgi:hypothetical protein